MAKDDVKIPKWMRTWNQKRNRGLARHLKPLILSDSELLGELIEDLVEDEDAQSKLKEMGYKIVKIKE